MAILNKERIISTNEKDITKNCWIHLTNPSMNTLEFVSNKTKINLQLLMSSVDEEESAHIDFEDGTTLVVIDMPYFDDGYYITIPLAMLYNKEYYVTICSKEIDLLEQMNKKNNIETNKHMRLSIQIFYYISNLYVQSLKKIDELTKTAEEQLVKYLKNKEILKLMNINKSLVHFSTSLNSNKRLLNRIDRSNVFEKYEQDYELMEDLKIEHNQAVEMCQLYREILTGSMESFSSMISNNMNNSMQTLAVLTLALSFPTIIASIFGMNVILPFTNNKYSFYLLILFSFILSIVGAIFIFKYTNRKNK